MTTLAWLCCGFGVVVILGITGTLAYDPYAVATGKTTISAFTLAASIASPLFAILVIAIVIMPPSILVGHLMWATTG